MPQWQPPSPFSRRSAKEPPKLATSNRPLGRQARSLGVVGGLLHRTPVRLGFRARIQRRGFGALRLLATEGPMNLSLVPRQKTFEDLGTPLFEVPFCVLDLETTGGSPRDCSITEIGAVKYVGGESTGSFHSLVNPGTGIPPFITVLTGLTTAMVTAAPQIEGVLPAFLEFLGASIVVGHNVRFDLGFLNAAALRLSYGRLPNRSIDTAALARRLSRPDVHNLKLASLAYHFRSPVTPDHRALTDARATAHVFFALLEIAGTIGVTALHHLLQFPTPPTS